MVIMTNLKLLVIIIILTLTTNLKCQVKEIKEDIKNDKKSKSSKSYTCTRSSSSTRRSSSYYDDEESFGEWILGEIFYSIVKGVGFVTYQAQKNVLENRDYYPNIISLKSGIDYGTTLFKENTLNPSIRLNWGIFASDFRYSLLSDETDNLQSLDWQVLIVRVPIKNLKINYGIGFTSVLSPQTSYFESSAGLDVNLMDSRLNFTANYRWTERKSEDRYRQEVKLTGDYVIMEKGVFHLSPMVGFTYQEYFNRHKYLFVNVGVRVRFSK